MKVNGNEALKRIARRWPEQFQTDFSVRRVLVCGGLDAPPATNHANFPRLELTLSGRSELRLVLKGQVQTIELKPGTVLFAPAKTWYQPTWRLPARVFTLSFEKKQIGATLLAGNGAGLPVLREQGFTVPWPATGPARRIVQAMTEMPSQGEPVRVLPELVRALLPCLRQLTRENGADQSRHGAATFNEICDYLHAHHLYEITRDSVAAQFDISPAHLSRLFQRHGQLRFSHYLAEIRIEHAKGLLKEAGLKVDDVAIRCGFRDTAYFCRVFKGLAKLTPGNYRGQSLLTTKTAKTTHDLGSVDGL